MLVIILVRDSFAFNATNLPEDAKVTAYFLATLGRFARTVALMADMKWRLIESAPKDGTLILVFGGKHTTVDIRAADSGWWNRYPVKDITPTHWMPLPSPPQTSKEK